MSARSAVVLLLASSAAAADLVVDGTTTVLDGSRSYASVQVVNGGVLTHSPGGALELSVTGTLFVDATSAIDASGKGYAAGRTVGDVTLGAATGRAGGTHGGYGFVAEWVTNVTYDDPLDPALPGAGAGPDNAGGAGGGVLRISAGTLVLDGSIRANGADGMDWYPSGGGGGAGGSIRIDADAIQGGGTVAANGGRGNMHCYYGCRSGGSGGGGRVAVRATSLAGFDIARITALGGDNATLDSGAGGTGTVYVKAAGAPGELRIVGSVAAPGAWTPLGLPGDDIVEVESLLVSGAGVVAAPEHDMPVVADDVRLESGAQLRHLSATIAETHELWLRVRDRLEIDATSSIDVSGRGYVAGRGLGNRTFGAATGVAGGSHGGLGGYTSNPVHGDPDLPLLPGAGGGPGGPSGSGGGVARVTAEVLVLDGTIRADGASGAGSWGNGAGGGAGGSVLVNAGTLSGAGFVSADGGDATYECYYGCRTGGSGGGGRVAIYARDHSAFDPAHLTATAGAVAWVDAAATGHDGTVVLAEEARVAWTAPQGDFLHGVETLGWEAYLHDPGTVLVDIEATGSVIVPVGSDLAATGTVRVDTATWPDGLYDVTATFRNGASAVATRRVLVDNSVAWHSGLLSLSESWAGGIVHVVEGQVVVGAGATLTVEPGAVVKFAPGTSLRADAGGSVVASGVEGSPVVFTALRDDTAGGDTNRDGGASLPRHGDWDGLAGAATLGDWVEVRYARAGHGGTLASSETWSASALHEVQSDLVVPAGMTLTIEPGAIVYFGRLLGITVNPGGTLVAQGTVAEPITLTSVAEGGNPEGFASGDGPAAGDWRWIHVNGGTATLDHVQMRYGGGTASGNWDSTGMLRTSGAASVTVSNSVLRDAFFDGILAWGGTVVVTSTVVTGADRGISAHPGSPVTVTNCTLDDNRIGLLLHGGTLSVANTIVAHSIDVGVQVDFNAPVSLHHVDVWSAPGSGAVNYAGTTDPTGTNGNISADPAFVDPARGDYRLGYGSPAIDAADGTAAPVTDAAGAPRVDDPRSPNTGLAGPGGTWADMGAREFVETAASDVDLVVTSVVGPATATPGETVEIEWTVYNQGTAPAQGPWHDALSLVRDPEQFPLDMPMAEVLSGVGLELVPGASITRRAQAVVPATIIGPHAWQVVTNVRGEVFEGANAANDAAQATQLVAITLPEIVIDGGPLSGTLGTEGAWRAFRIAPVPGQGFRVELDRSTLGDATDLYVSAGSMPTAERYDARSTAWNQPDAVVIVPDPAPLTYYVLAVARTATAASTFTISASTSELALGSVSPTMGGTAGSVTLTVLGEAFPVDATVRLIASDGQPWPAASQVRIDSTRIEATFELGAAAPGAADLVLEGGGASRTLEDAFTLVAGGAPGFWFEMAGPAAVRAGREATFTLRWGNSGLVDAPLHVIDVPIPEGSTMRLAPGAAPLTERLLLLTTAGRCTGLVMPPGWTDSRELFVTASLVSRIEFGVAAAGLTDPALAEAVIDWDAAGLVSRPDGLGDAAWAAFWAEHVAQLGPTWGTMLLELGETAAALKCSDDTGGMLAAGGVPLLQAELAKISEAMVALGWDAGVPASAPVSGGGSAQAANGAPPQQRIQSLLIGIGDGGGVESDFAKPEDNVNAIQHYLWTTAEQPQYRGAKLIDRPGRSDDDLGATALLDAVRSLASRTGPGEVGFFYYSGHGSATSISTKANAVFYSEIYDRLNAALVRTSPAPAAKMVVVLEACHSGGFIDYLYSVGADPSKWIVMSAAETKQKAYQPTLSPFDLGFFTKGLTDRLAGGGSLHDAWAGLPDNLNAWAFSAQKSRFFGSDTSFTLRDPDGDAKHPRFGPSPGGLGAGRPPGARPCTTPGCDPGATVAGSYDPNEKLTQGVGTEGYVDAGQPITFTIWFENDPEQGATAPVQELLVTDDLSPLLDAQGLELAAIGFGGVRVEIPPGHDAFSTVAHRPGDPNPITIDASLDRATSRLSWRLTSVDPATASIPDDPYAGFLPVNDEAGAGQGFVSFRVAPRADLADGTEILNEATITFDPTFGVNPPIVTNRTLNVVGDPPPCACDCDLDGIVTADEIALAADVLLGRSALTECGASDADRSGVVTARDLVAGTLARAAGCTVE